MKKAITLLKILGDVELKLNMKDNQLTIHIAKKSEGIGTKAKNFRAKHRSLKDLIKIQQILWHIVPRMTWLQIMQTKPMVGYQFKDQAAWAMRQEEFYFF